MLTISLKMMTSSNSQKKRKLQVMTRSS